MRSNNWPDSSELNTIYTYSFRKCCIRKIVLCTCYRGHRKLHSFPTRRSSDLGSKSPAWNMSSPTWARRSRPGRCGAAAWWCRSEEHTSELQSRGHLVCRLLLEKKKNKLSFFAEGASVIGDLQVRNYRTIGGSL